MGRTVFFLLFILIPSFFFGQKSGGSADRIFIDTIQKSPGGENIQKSKTFYDSIYNKFSRHRFTKMMYNLAFSEPVNYPISDTVQKISGAIPFLKFRGKIIRSIRIYILSPFGEIIADSIEKNKTKIGGALNAAHMNTRKFVIRKNLLFKKGDIIDPHVFSDNERLLREMPSINNVRILISQPDSHSDSVDVTIVTKDVWSIGFNLQTLTTNRANFYLYDANFLGLVDRLTISFSMELKRSPFIRPDGFSYQYTNIGGSFINTLFNFSVDDKKEKNLLAGFQRSFFANKIRWAGGALFNYVEDVSEKSDLAPLVSYSTSEDLWFGWAIRLKKEKEPTRLVLTTGFYNRIFSSRPFVSIDSNRGFYNSHHLLGVLSISRNNYYLTNYVFEFGKTENIPFGYLVQLTGGHESTDFYQRFYTGLELSGGDFFLNLGYFSGRAILGGYFNKSVFEDAVFKVQLRYMTKLYNTTSHYKFRLYFYSFYRLGFNMRNNNVDFTDLNQYLRFNNVKNRTILRGIHSWSVNLAPVLFTPWYFYGFKFALQTQFQGGFVSSSSKALFKNNAFFSGIKVGCMIKNDNLIFPTFVLSLFFYPSSPADIKWFQYAITDTPNLDLPDYNVSAPRIETIQN